MSGHKKEMKMANKEQTAEEKSNEAVEKVRPLSATQSKALMNLVENDFSQLESQMKTMHDEMVNERIKEIRAEADQEKIRDLREQAWAMINEYNSARDRLMAEARGADLSLTFPQINTYPDNSGRYAQPGQVVSISDVEVEKKISSYKAEAATELQAALDVSKRKLLESKRKILLATITSQAEEILSSIPSAQTLMVEAAQERTARALERNSNG